MLQTIYVLKMQILHILSLKSAVFKIYKSGYWLRAGYKRCVYGNSKCYGQAVQENLLELVRLESLLCF